MRRVAFGLVLALASVVVPSSAVAAPIFVHAPAHLSMVGSTSSQSTNWSGYGDTGATFTRVHATWTQPAATCATSQHQYASFWVGLDGFASNSVEQIGTDSDCAGKNNPVYYAWYEMYPAPSIELSPASYPVHVADSMTALVKVAKTTFTLTLTNNTQGWTFTTVQSSSTAKKSSAEWVAEAPSSCSSTCTILPLADFGKVKFTATGVTGGGVAGTITSFTNDEIVMVTTGGIVRAQPTAVTHGFSDTWHHV